MGEDRLRLGHSPRATSLPDREQAIVRRHDVIADALQVRDVLLRLRMRPHVVVHRRDEHHRRAGREENGGEQVVRAPRNGEAATVEVLELYGSLNADSHVIALDTTGAGSTARPRAYSDNRTTRIRAIYRPAVLPSLNYDILFDLGSKDGMKIGDEIEMFRPREAAIQDERSALPEVHIGTAQVVRVTPYGSTARVTSQEQPAIRVGESVRVIARITARACIACCAIVVMGGECYHPARPC